VLFFISPARGISFKASWRFSFFYSDNARGFDANIKLVSNSDDFSRLILLVTDNEEAATLVAHLDG
jgi:hypothetical protein